MGKRRSESGGAGVRRVSRVPSLPVRVKDSHKGSYGRVLVIGGSRGMVGAPALVAQAALRSGAGLVTVACPASIQQSVAVLCPCATSLPVPETADGCIDPVAARRELEAGGWLESGRATVAIGPGLGRGDEVFDASVMELIRAFTGDAQSSVVVDADAINAFPVGQSLDLSRVVLTPHPGEMARLHGTSTESVQGVREQIALATVGLMAARDESERPVVVLKGHRTIVTDGAALYVNNTGNAGMATGGTGDVLTGVIAALIAQGMKRMDAAILGVNLHGAAGDLTAREKGLHGLIATDVIEALPLAFRKSTKRR